MTLPSLPYEDFLKRKIILSEDWGIEIDPATINPVLKPHQRDAVVWCIRGARRGVFGQFGLGKTIMQLEVAHIIVKLTGKPFLIGLPLGVKQEFEKDAHKLGYQVQYIKEQSDVNGPGIYMSNYERIREAKFDPSAFGGVSFDEASVIRSMGTLTTQYILSHFSEVKFRFVFTATPSPNEYHELLKYAHFLGIMDISQALNRYFKRDSQKAHHSTLLEHRSEDFWLWMHSWAIFATKPSDINKDYSDAGFDLPPMKVIYHEVSVKDRTQAVDRDGNVILFNDASRDFRASAREKRDSLDARVKQMKKIIKSASAADHWIIWHHLEDERRAIEKALPKAVSVYGAQSQEEKEKYLIGFGEGDFKHMATKPEIAGSGCNFQYHCHKVIFLGIDHGFNDFIQAIHRVYRPHQPLPVEIHIIYTDSEHSILKSLKAKWYRHDIMIQKMVDIIRAHGLNKFNINIDKRRTFMVQRQEVKGKNYTAINNDAVLELPNIPDNTVDFELSSIPFSDMFEYSESYNDMGQSNGDAEFFAHLDYLTPHKLRVLKPGRICCVHVKDAIQYSYQNGMSFTTINEFSDKVVAHYKKHGYWYMGRITVTTDVVQENGQTYRLGWSENSKDSSKMGVGLPEYILIFRKAPTEKNNAYADEPVTKSKEDYTRARWQLDAHSFWRSNGNRFLRPEEIRKYPLNRIMRVWKDFDQQSLYDFNTHVQACEDLDAAKKLPTKFMALPPQSKTPYVWDDVVRIKTLNTSQAVANKIKHVCPLQFDIVDRLIERYSNPGDIVLDEFSGIFTVAFRAIKLKRKAIGIELNSLYMKDGLNYLKAEEYNESVPTLFSMMEDDQKSA
jgi:hypothetical protein